MGSIRKIKVVTTLSAVAALAFIGSGRGQDVGTPALPPVTTPLPSVTAPAPLALEIPRPPTVEELRDRKRAEYISLHTKLVAHLTDAQLQERTEALQKEVNAAQERSAKAAREKQAKDELAKAKEMLAQIANKYKGTDAGAKAQQALDQANDAPVPPK